MVVVNGAYYLVFVHTGLFHQILALTYNRRLKQNFQCLRKLLQDEECNITNSGLLHI